MTWFDWGKRVGLWLICGFTILFGYALAKLEPFAAAQLLPLTWVDRSIPLLPWTVWIYGSGTLTCLIACLCIPDTLSARRLWVSLALSAMVCWVFFFLWPTTYPRELWPTPAGDSWTLAELADLRDTDSPSNCFPSQHVALAWSLALCWADWTRRRWVKVGIVVWAAAVSVCTLTTKQHYLVDVPGGFLAGVGAWWVVRGQIVERVRSAGLAIERDRDRVVLEGLLAKVQAQRWTLDQVAWPEGPLPPLPRAMHQLLSHTVWIEEIAGLNFQLLRDASDDAVLRELYACFADEERRHADALRRVLALHGHETELPGMGTALILDQFDELDPADPADVALVITATPVFETFLDAGTIPFLAAHPSLHSSAFDALVERIDRDEGAHLATNWLMSAQAARAHRGLRGLVLLLNPNIVRGMLAVPWLGLETYARAHALGFQFDALLPAFGKLWRRPQKVAALRTAPLWQLFRLFTVCGVIATWVTHQLARHRLLFIGFWNRWASATDRLAWLVFGRRVVEKRGLAVRT